MPEGFKQGTGAERHHKERSNEALEAALAKERAEREKAEQARDAAERDELTGLPRRRPFIREATPLFAPPGESEGYFPHIAVIFADLDNFKQVNDTYGHEKGDEVLKAVTRALADGIRPTDLISRWGGEEIVILLPGATETQAALRAEELRKDVKQLSFMSDEGKPISVSASFGVAAMDNKGAATLAELTKRADAALYAAKEGGRNRVALAGDNVSERPASQTVEPEQFGLDYGEKEPPEQLEMDV